MSCFDSLSIFTNSYNLNLKFIFFFFLCFVYRKTLEHKDSNSVCILLPFTLAGIFLRRLNVDAGFYSADNS